MSPLFNEWDFCSDLPWDLNSISIKSEKNSEFGQIYFGFTLSKGEAILHMNLNYNWQLKINSLITLVALGHHIWPEITTMWQILRASETGAVLKLKILQVISISCLCYKIFGVLHIHLVSDF